MNRTNNPPKRDGHTHSQFCPHAQIASTADLVEKAIAEGFADYSITEHPPLPEEMTAKHPQYLSDYAMSESEIDDYVKHALELKKTYADRIRIRVGFEFEFFPTGNAHTEALAEEYRGAIDDCLISLHFLPAADGLRMIDFSPEDNRKRLLPHYRSFEAVHRAYWEQMEAMAHFNLKGLNPRIGHPGLIHKFIKAQPVNAEQAAWTCKFLEEKFFPALGKNSRTLDFNVRGISQELYRRPYLDSFMSQLCHQHRIPAVYGSDSHSVDDVGKYHPAYESFLRQTSPSNPETGKGNDADPAQSGGETPPCGKKESRGEK